ncbi:hypothetical protein [Duganella sp. Leaf61]|uniref:hypothetical protein n=1 Tax=Duganella sp. Leaf61 TaxID=1736227 RepID=UPI000A8CDC32|nr:hypothetical protein [Duganella sp. Leaf61]
MNRATFGKQGKWAAMLGVLVIVGLAGCASDSMDSNRGYTSSGSSGSGTAATGTGPGGGGGVPAAGTAGAGTSSSGSTDSSGMSSTSSYGSGTSGSMGSSTAQATYGVVQAIDPMPRDMAGSTGVGVSGAAVTGGTMNTSSESPYRITVRMDDGTSQSIVVDTMPPYKIGDRVRYSSGVLSAY